MSPTLEKFSAVVMYVYMTNYNKNENTFKSHENNNCSLLMALVWLAELG